MSIDTLINIFQSSTSQMKACFFSSMTWVWKDTFLIVPDFCDQLVSKLDDESCTGKRYLSLPSEVVREFCTVRFYIAGSEESRCRC